METAFSKTVEEVLTYFDSDPENGLSDDQVKKQTAKFGPNGKLL
ncbi:unnamed protein product [Trichobilharzia regenti]|nr:unnamed protein product [Trichobilharzia regenti]